MRRQPKVCCTEILLYSTVLMTWLTTGLRVTSNNDGPRALRNRCRLACHAMRRVTGRGCCCVGSVGEGAG